MSASYELVVRENIVQLQSVDLLARFLDNASADIDGKVADVAADAAAAGASAEGAAESEAIAADAASSALASAEALFVYTGGYFYPTIADGVADTAVGVGDSFVVEDSDKRVYLGKKTGPSTGEQGAEFATVALLNVGLFTAMAARVIPAGIDALRTSGYSVKGIGAARYIYDAAVDEDYVADHPRSSFITANGRGFRIAEDVIDAKMLGARSGQDSAAAINETMQVAYEYGHSLWTLWKEGTGVYVIEGQGATNPEEPESDFQRGVITSRPNLHGASNGAELVIKAADHVKNGPSIFGHHYWLYPDLGDAGLLGEWTLNGNMYDAERNPGGIPFDDGRDGSGVFTEADVYQFQHGFSVYKSSGTITLGRITAKNMRGDGIEIGMAAGGDNYVERFKFDRLHAIDIFREGIGLFNLRYYDINEIIAQGNGFWVGVIDPEGHSQTDRVRNGRIGRIHFDATTGLSPPERTPSITNPAEREAARAMMRRIFSASHFYDGFPDDTFDGRWANISIGEVVGIQACMDVYYFANVRIGQLTLSMPYEEDLSAHALLPENDGSVDAVRCHGNGVTGMYGFGFDAPPRITGHYAHGIWVSNYDDVLIPDGTVVTGTKKSAVRLDDCSGRCGHVKATDCGLTSARAYAVEAWGGKGPLFIRDAVAIDTRAGSSRTMQGAVQLNGTSSVHVDVTGARNLNTFGTDPVVNVGQAAVAEGNMDMTAPVHGFSTPVSFGTVDSGFEVNGNLTVGDMGGGAATNITVRAPSGYNANLNWSVAGVLQYQMQQTSDGSMQGLQFDGTFTRVDFNIPEAGGFNLPSITYDKPVRIGSARLWPDTAGTWLTKNTTDATSDADSTVVGDQTGA